MFNSKKFIKSLYYHMSNHEYELPFLKDMPKCCYELLALFNSNSRLSDVDIMKYSVEEIQTMLERSSGLKEEMDKSRFITAYFKNLKIRTGFEDYI